MSSGERHLARWVIPHAVPTSWWARVINARRTTWGSALAANFFSAINLRCSATKPLITYSLSLLSFHEAWRWFLRMITLLYKRLGRYGTAGWAWKQHSAYISTQTGRHGTMEFLHIYLEFYSPGKEMSDFYVNDCRIFLYLATYNSSSGSNCKLLWHKKMFWTLKNSSITYRIRQVFYFLA